jgi:hypothetical protein
VRHGRADFEGWHVACAPAEVQARGIALRTARDAARAPAPAPEGGSAGRAGNGPETATRGAQEAQRRAVDRTAVLVLDDDGAALVVAETAGTRYPIPTPDRVGGLAREAAALDLTRVWIPTDTLTRLGLAEMPEPRRAEDVTGSDHPWSEPAPGIEQRGPRGLGSWMTFTVPEVRSGRCTWPSPRGWAPGTRCGSWTRPTSPRRCDCSPRPSARPCRCRCGRHATSSRRKPGPGAPTAPGGPTSEALPRARRS